MIFRITLGRRDPDWLGLCMLFNVALGRPDPGWLWGLGLCRLGIDSQATGHCCQCNSQDCLGGDELHIGDYI